jgi:small subunit ribosomal protein S6
LTKRHYESYIIVDGNLEDSIVEEIVTKYESFLKKNDVEIKNIDRIGRKRLAYPIKKKQNGFYICYEIISYPDLISKLERTYKLDEDVLRYLTIFMSKRTLKEKEEHLKKRALMKAKFEEEKKEAERKEAEKKEAEGKQAVKKESSDEKFKEKEDKSIPEKTEEKISQD